MVLLNGDVNLGEKRVVPAGSFQRCLGSQGENNGLCWDWGWLDHHFGTLFEEMLH